MTRGATDDERALRITKNELVFRDLNERVRKLGGELEPESGLVWEFVCECSNVDCADRIELSRSEYEHIRSRHTFFVVVPGHELPEIERVVERADGYAIVEKDAADVSAATADGGEAPPPSGARFDFPGLDSNLQHSGSVSGGSPPT
jgi:hypothetical protein